MINDVTGFTWRKAQNLLKKQGVQNVVIAGGGKLQEGKTLIVTSATYSADGKTVELTLGSYNKD